MENRVEANGTSQVSPEDVTTFHWRKQQTAEGPRSVNFVKYVRGPPQLGTAQIETDGGRLENLHGR